MFAGPNGSGKSTIKAKFEIARKPWLSVFVNPDEIEARVRRAGALEFKRFQIKTDENEVRDFFRHSALLKKGRMISQLADLGFKNNRLIFGQVEFNSYFASVASDFIRGKLMEARQSFSFETVMSSPDKVLFLRRALAAGYRTYLYFVATDDPDINISRVELRVKEGGHNVPHQKIKSRYYRSLGLLADAIGSSNRAYIFDNSGAEAFQVAEITDGKRVELKTKIVPAWFRQYVLKKVK
jgi:predicted ABC-type ATPase